MPHGRRDGSPAENGPRVRKQAFRGGRSRDSSLQEDHATRPQESSGYSVNQRVSRDAEKPTLLRRPAGRSAKGLIAELLLVALGVQPPPLQAAQGDRYADATESACPELELGDPDRAVLERRSGGRAARMETGC